MKTIRLLYTDYVIGNLDTYYFGANLLSHILPANDKQKLVHVDITPPDGTTKSVTDGIYAKDEVIAGIVDAKKKLRAQKPDKVITIGGNCIVSLAPFDYLHGMYDNLGIIWIDAHPDVSTPLDGYPNAHAMVLGSLMGHGSHFLADLMENKKFSANEILYIGLQSLHDYQKKFLDETGVTYKVQTEEFISDNDILTFIQRFSNVLIHFDIDVLDENIFHSTYFANKNLVGDGAGGGKMTIEKLNDLLHLITDRVNVVGFTIAEYLPFDEHKLHKMFSSINIFTKE